MQEIPPHHLVFFDKLAETYPLRVELVYAQPENRDNHFGPIYDPAARLIGHRDLAAVICLAATYLYKTQGWELVLKDCLRTTEAQARMIDTDVVRANPHWIQEPRFLSGPGQGGHPRGMAIDVGAIDANGNNVDFGTAFDYFSSSSDVSVNKAHRQYKGHSEAVNTNRALLETALTRAAEILGHELFPLPQEWWDFRFPSSYTTQFKPISDADMPDGYWMTKPNTVHALCDEALMYIERKLKDKSQAALSVIGPCARP